MSTQVETEAQLRELFSQAGPVWLMKHSSACGVSHAAFDEYSGYLTAHPEQSASHIVIQSHRPLSNLAAELSSVVHKSPQLFLLVNGDVKFVISHWGITAQAMADAWSAAAD